MGFGEHEDVPSGLEREISHPLDSPIWNALTTRHRGFAEGDERALRYPAEIAPFAAMPEASVENFAALSRLIGPAAPVALFTVEPVSPPDYLETILARTLEQMMAPATEGPVSLQRLEPLGPVDAPAMRELADLTKPGPFNVRTHELGRFLGVKVGGVLVAMAGERMSLNGFTEVTAVCTHPDHRGHGYARALLEGVARGVRARGDAPFLHVFSDNEAAIDVYRKAGFTIRRQMHLAVLGKPS